MNCEDLSVIYAEVWEMIKFLNINDLRKIPDNVFLEINNKRNKFHKSEYDPEISIEKQNIKEESKEFFSALYFRYCCSDEEKKHILEKWINNEKRIQA